jgi:hypothetical protein
VTVVERYLELGLRLGRHAEELVDSYYGPEEIAWRVEAEDLRGPEALAEDAAALLADVDRDPWLAAQVRSLHATARKLAGERFSYVEEGELVYGLQPLWHDEADFEQGRRLLEDALPGGGDLRDRYRRWFEETAIPTGLVEQAVLDTAEELRRRTRAMIGLPDGEGFELELVDDKPWFGYAHYLGNLRTRISVNTDLPFPAADLVHLTSHEIYGGHHTHRVWQDAEPVRGRGEVERTLDLLWSPEAVLSEGIAETGPTLVAGNEAAAIAAEVLGRLGFAFDAEVGAAVTSCRKLLSPVSANVSMLLHDAGAPQEDALEYAREWALQPDERLEKLVRDLARRPSPCYQHTYWQGRELVGAHVRGDAACFRELLTARLLPADLAASQPSK